MPSFGTLSTDPTTTIRPMRPHRIPIRTSILLLTTLPLPNLITTTGAIRTWNNSHSPNSYGCLEKGSRVYSFPFELVPLREGFLCRLK